MNLHAKTRLTPEQRKEIWKDYTQKGIKIAELSRLYRVSRITIYKILERARKKEFIPRKSINKRYRCLEYGIKRLAKIEKKIEEKKKREAKRYNKSYPGEMIHVDTKALPHIENKPDWTKKKERLYVAIDDYSRDLYVAILPDKTQSSSRKFLEQVLEECPYSIECIYSDNGTEFKGNKEHEFAQLCEEKKIVQKFTKPKNPKTNGKAERVIRTLMDMWYNKHEFKNYEHRKKELIRFGNYYNMVKPHKGIDNLTPHEKLLEYFFPQKV